MAPASGQYWRWMGAFIEMHDRLREHRQADHRPHQRHLRRRRQRAADGLRPVGAGRRRVHPPRRPGARLGAGRRRDPVAADHGRRPAGARDRACCARRSRARRRSSGASSTAWCHAAELDATVATLAASLRAQAARDDALHEDPAQLVARPGLAATVTHARDWLALSMLGRARRRSAVRGVPGLEGSRSALVLVEREGTSRSCSSTARGAQCAFRRAHGRAGRGAPRAGRRREVRCIVLGRLRAGLRGGRRHRRDGDADTGRDATGRLASSAGTPIRALPDAARGGRAPGSASGAAASWPCPRSDRGRRDCGVRAARDALGDHPRRRGHAAADAGGRQGARHGHDPLGTPAVGARSAPGGAGGAGGGEGGVARRGQACSSDIASKGPVANRLAKEAVDRAFEGPLTVGLDYERRSLYLAFASEDASEGLAAFTEKREPNFRGE